MRLPDECVLGGVSAGLAGGVEVVRQFGVVCMCVLTIGALFPSSIVLVLRLLVLSLLQLSAELLVPSCPSPPASPAFT